MTEQEERTYQDVRLLVRVQIMAISPMDVAEIQEGIRDVVSDYTDAEVETTMLPVLPQR